MKPSLCRGSFASLLLKRYGRQCPRLFMIGQMKRRCSIWIEDPSPPGKDGRPLSIYYNELVAIFQEFDHQNTSQTRYSWRSHSTRSVNGKTSCSYFLEWSSWILNMTKWPKRFWERIRNWIWRVVMHMFGTWKLSLRKLCDSSHSSSTGSSTKLYMSGPEAQHQHMHAFRLSGLVYHHCGEAGHSKFKCYEVVGYLELWDFTKKPMSWQSECRSSGYTSTTSHCQCSSHR